MTEKSWTTEQLGHEARDRRTRHEAACRYAVMGCETLRRADGRWQVLRGGTWRDLDPAPSLGEPVK